VPGESIAPQVSDSGRVGGGFWCCKDFKYTFPDMFTSIDQDVRIKTQQNLN